MNSIHIPNGAKMLLKFIKKSNIKQCHSQWDVFSKPGTKQEKKTYS
jgi:hypothetical protein